MATARRRTSLIPVLLAASIAVPIGLLLVSAWVNYRQVEQSAIESARYTAAALTEHALRTIRGHELVISFVAGHIRGMSWPQIRNSARLHRLLERVAREHDDIASVLLVDRNGVTALNSVAFPARPVDNADREYFTRLRDGAPYHVSGPALGRVTGQRFFSLARPLLDESGTFWGAVVVSVNPQYFEAFYRSLMPSTQAASLVRQDGVVLARYPGVDELQVIPQDNVLMRAIRESAGAGVVAGTSFVDGMERIFAYQQVGNYPIHATFQLARAAIWAQWRTSMVPYLLASLLAFAGLLTATQLAQQRAGRAIAEQKRRDAEEASQAKDRFVATLSHEIRNPLAAIAGASELLRRRPAAAGMASEVIARQLEQMRAILDDLLDTARTIFGKLRLDKRRLDLYALAKEAVEERAAREQPRVQLELEGERAWIEADPNRLRQILDNLLENAVRYGARHITVSVRRAPDCQELAVADDGEGIAPELLSRLFQPFVQGEQALDRPRGGLGLGLALVSHLARLHGGRVEARSAGRGRGATFTVYLPRAEAPIKAVPTPAHSAPAVPRRILFVEDERDARETLARLLVDEGHEVMAVASADEAFAALGGDPPEVALLDIGLPGMDGYELARRIRAGQGGRDVLLVAVTGYGQPHDQQKAMAAGFDAHLTKPFAFEHLTELITKRASAAATIAQASRG